MPLSPRGLGRVLAVASGCLLTAIPASAQDARRGGTWEQDQHEEKVIQRAAERAIKAADSEGARWHKEMAAAYPGQVGPGLTEAEVAKWFDLLSGENKEWRKDAVPNRRVAGLFDRLAERLELGPVPFVRRDEFQHFARKQLVSANPQKHGERSGEADRLFRVLDRDGSGVLEPGEWTERLRAEAKTADADGNRRIDLNEYRAYFEGRVAEAAEAGIKAATGPAKSGPAARGGGLLPAWFKELDKDADGQVGLYEWRAAGKDIKAFLAMDLDGDGLLTPEEYQRYVRATEAEARRLEAEADRVPDEPTNRRAGMKRMR